MTCNYIKNINHIPMIPMAYPEGLILRHLMKHLEQYQQQQMLFM